MSEEKEVDTSPEGIKRTIGYVYEDIQTIIKTYLDISEEYVPIIALWIIGTYMHKQFEAYPFLYLNAQRGSGKTRLLKIIAQLSYKSFGQVQTGITESVLFRSDKGTTLVLDECEGIASKDQATLREYLNASYKKGAIVKRSKKVKSTSEEGYKLETFEPYRPIALANIYGMNDVLGDRCLTLILEKSNNPGKTKLLENFQDNPHFLAITRTLNELLVYIVQMMYMQGYVDKWNTYISNKYNTLFTLPTTSTLPTLSTQEDLRLEAFFGAIDKSGINGRNLELVFPLLIIADYLGESVSEQILKIIKGIIDSKREQEFAEDKDVCLIDFVSSQERFRFDWISLTELTRLFREYLGEYDNEERWLNEKWVSKAIKRLKLSTQVRRASRGMQLYLAVDHAKEKKKMYKDGGTNEA